jgi:AraC-like DNA-binding protein
MKTTIKPLGEAPYVALGYLRPLLDYLTEQKYLITPVLDALGLSENELVNLDRFVPAHMEADAYAVAETLTGDVNIGLHVGRGMLPSYLGVVGHLLLTCGTGAEVFALHERYARLFTNRSITEYHRDAETTRLCFRCANGCAPLSRHQAERMLVSLITLTRGLMGAGIALTRIEFPFKAPADLTEQEQVFQCELVFEKEEFSCFFPNAYFDLPLMQSAPDLRHMLEAESRKKLHALIGAQTSDDPQIAELKNYISTQLSMGTPELGVVAEALKVSPRRLQRMLETQGTSYTEITDAVRRDTAMHYLKNAELTLIEIAIMLGFSDQSTFNRAFKRWFDVSPGEYRKTQSNKP